MAKNYSVHLSDKRVIPLVIERWGSYEFRARYIAPGLMFANVAEVMRVHARRDEWVHMPSLTDERDAVATAVYLLQDAVLDGGVYIRAVVAEGEDSPEYAAVRIAGAQAHATELDAALTHVRECHAEAQRANAALVAKLETAYQAIALAQGAA